MPGPAPSPNARRRNDQTAWRTLPAVCRRAVPDWPLKGRKPAGLLDLWRHLWTLPVAELWHEQNAVRLVARYALLVLDSERATNSDALKCAAECRQLEDRLLISPSTRIRARVLVEAAPTEPTETRAGVVDLDHERASRLAGR